MPLINREYTTQPPAAHPPRMERCACVNNKKTEHYYQRTSASGPVYVCGKCGAEKVITK